MKFILTVLLILLAFPLSAMAGDAVSISAADANATAGSFSYGSYANSVAQKQGLVNAPETSQSMTLNQSTTIDAGQGRLFVNTPPLFQAPLVNYFGPWKEGANILENNAGLPEVVTLKEAESLYGGGVDSEVRLFGKVTATFDKCKLLTTIPTEAEKVGYVFLKGSSKANTIDLLAMAYQTAMNSGANAIVILKKQATTKASAWGVGIGTSAAAGILSGSEKDKSQVGSGGFGISYGSASPKYEDGMAILMLNVKGLVGKKASLPVPEQQVYNEKMKADFAKITTGTYTPTVK